MSKRTFLFYSRPVFRTCEIACNHAARVLSSTKILADPNVRHKLAELDQRRVDLQGVLNRIGNSHSQACAECKGKCCGGVRERDAFIDRIIQDPETPHLSARRKTGQMAAYKLVAADSCSCSGIKDAQPAEGYCPELTVEGCKIPYELRPIQCVAYFCNKAADLLSPQECAEGAAALKGLMGVQISAVGLMLKARLGMVG